MSALKAKTGNPPQDSSRKNNTNQRYDFARVNQSTIHLVDRGANGGLACADMRVLRKPDRKIKIVGIDDHELTGLDVVTAHALFDTQKGPVIGLSMNMLILERGDLFCCLANGNTYPSGVSILWAPPTTLDLSSRIWFGLYTLHPGSY